MLDVRGTCNLLIGSGATQPFQDRVARGECEEDDEEAERDLGAGVQVQPGIQLRHP